MVILFKRISFVLRKAFGKERAAKLAELAKIALIKGEEGIDQHYVHGPEAEATHKLAEAASKLIDSTKGVDELIIRAGSLLLVKYTQHGRSKVVVETMSPRLRRILDEKPTLMKQPKHLFREMERLNAPVRTLPLVSGEADPATAGPEP